MNIQELKTKIENKSVGPEGIVFIASNTFIPKQYITEISNIYGRPIHYAQTEAEIVERKSLFGAVISSDINVYITDTIDHEIKVKDFCYVICTKYVGDGVQVPKLESWHILDYLKTNSSELIPVSQLEQLAKACKDDIYHVDNELSKYRMFLEQEQKLIFNRLYESNQLERNFEGTIFDFTNALLNKDKSTLVKFYKDLQNYDIEPLGVVTIIYKQLRNIINVGFNTNPTEQNTGLSSKQIYWIKKNLSKYSSKYILESFQVICEAEKLMKEGTLTNSQLLDWVVVNLL